MIHYKHKLGDLLIDYEGHLVQVRQLSRNAAGTQAWYDCQPLCVPRLQLLRDVDVWTVGNADVGCSKCCWINIESSVLNQLT